MGAMIDPNTERGAALVLFSGGQDSTVCLAWALDRYSHVETVGFAPLNPPYDACHDLVALRAGGVTMRPRRR